MAFEASHRPAPNVVQNLHEYLTGVVTEPGTVNTQNVINPATEPRRHFIRDVVRDLASQAPHTQNNVELLASLIETELQGGYVDDKKYQVG